MGTKPSVDRDELLRLLREDEEFRLAVMGLLSIVDIQSGIRQLVGAIARLAEAQRNTWEVVRQVRGGEDEVLNLLRQSI